MHYFLLFLAGKRAFAFNSCLLALLLTAFGCATTPPTAAVVTTVYIVRHAEKDPTPGLADPALTPAGEQRATALRDKIGQQPVVAIFTTNTTRTRTTVAPLAAARQLTPQVYDARQLGALADRIRGEFAGKTVVVVGHSNTILETAEALGVTRPVAIVNDNEFSYLLEVKLPSSGAPTVDASRYGAQ
ncbi:histidine phosphatase family protein [Hymenobacter elongatus]|uniref:Histidine phosphatase family protein n=1 Tax=Hymenobacter elongatus TaxID=877208 RepID=A0A4Z0PQU6_9BACT|nr:histidine phosphatase family protein [Hymenobacter elongatus]TGE19998.1 histidine phosphatase family protein [Hymenobacter elongatus]